MEVNESVIMQLLGQLSGLGATAQTKPWMSYGGIQQGPATLVQQARGQVESISQTLLGPMFGGLVGPYAADLIVGRDFTRHGMLHNRLSGLLAPQSGTYASAYQRMGRAQTLATLKDSRQEQDQKLKRAFYTNYYNVTNPGGNTEAAVDAAMRNPLSLPSALRFLFDPAKDRQTMQGIKNTQAGFLNWQQRLNGGSLAGMWQRKETAKQIGQSVGKMAMNANLWQLGMQDQIKDQRYKGKSYGGFTGASVSQLASIIANASDVFDPKNIGDSIKKFQQKVQDTAKALSPLKDIFGGDIKAMTDMLQSVTGQNINQLSPNMIRSIATSTVDMSRYSGATVAQMAQAGQKLFLQTAQTGQNSFARVGGGQLGTYYSGLLAQGNSPAGVHAAQYAGSTQRALASAQTSAGADFAAMAYGLWLQKNKGKSLDDFMSAVNNSQLAKNGKIMDALIEVSGAGTQQGLLKGLSYTGYREALQSGRMAQFGVKGQYYEQLSDAIGYMKVANTDESISVQHWDALQKVLKNQQNAAEIKNLVTNANNPQAVEAFAKRFNLNQKAVNRYLNTSDMLQYTARWASTAQIDNYKATQAKIRKQLAPLDQMGANGFNAFWQAASQGVFGEKTTADGKKISGLSVKGKVTDLGKQQIVAQGRMIFGDTLKTGTFEEVQGIIQKLQDKTAFGDQASQVLALASTQMAGDQTFLKSIRTMATKDKNSAEYKQAKGYIQARRLGYIGKQTGKDFKDETAKGIYQKALSQYQSATDNIDVHAMDDKTKAIVKTANEKLQEELGRATRLQNISKMSASQLGLKGNFDTKKKALAAFIEKGSSTADKLLGMDQKSFNAAKSAHGLSDFTKTQFQRAYRASGVNYGNTADFQRMLYTVLDQILAWLRKQSQGSNKK